ncbi:hypothetical protein MMC09_005731 [Bachmanniomyces sp. S44760]|nr:hypothetical protein [Bachmanniomyces sp. S44760]
MVNIINVALRGLQFFFTLLILAIDGNIIAKASGGNPSIINYVIFTAVFAMLALVYLIATTFNEGFAIFPWAPLLADALCTLFFLIGGIALAAYLGVHSCGNQDYIKSNLVTSGAVDQSKRCHEAQAVCAFLWFGFAAFAASMVFSGLASRGGSSGFRGGIRRGGPSMSQV